MREYEGGPEMIDELEKCPKCGNEEAHIRRDGRTVLCWKCKHEHPGDWVKDD